MYSDTDSIRIHINAGRLISLGDELGDMSNDLSFGGRIVKAFWIAPKMYILIYVCDPALIPKAAAKDALSKGVTVEKLLALPKYALLQRIEP
jgi:hypothetical protein